MEIAYKVFLRFAELVLQGETRVLNDRPCISLIVGSSPLP